MAPSSNPRDRDRAPVRIRFILPDLSRLPWLQGFGERLIERYAERPERIVLPKLDPSCRAPSALERRRLRNPRTDRQELVAAAVYGAVGLAITFGLMFWAGAIDLGMQP